MLPLFANNNCKEMFGIKISRKTHLRQTKLRNRINEDAASTLFQLLGERHRNGKRGGSTVSKRRTGGIQGFMKRVIKHSGFTYMQQEVAESGHCSFARRKPQVQSLASQVELGLNPT